MTSFQYKYPPPEIWDQILSEVTYYPGEFDPDEWVGGNKLELARRDITSSMSTNQFILYNRTQGDSFRFQLDTRYSLVLVCRQWYNLAIRYLYSSVLVKRTGINKLANLVASNESLGPLIKRLDLEWAPGDHVSDLISVLSACTNLAIFYQRPGNPGAKMVPWWHFLKTTPAINASLRYAGGDPAGIPDVQVLTSIPSLTCLVVFRLPSLLVPNSAPALTPRVPIRFPKLRVLDFGDAIDQELLSYVCDWDLPDLQTIWVRAHIARVAPPEFWKKNGKKLTTIKVYNPRPDEVAIRLGNVSFGFESLGLPPSEILPRLRQLIVYRAIDRCTQVFLPGTSLEIYEVSIQAMALGGHPFSHALLQTIKAHTVILSADKAPKLRILRFSDCPRNPDDQPWKEFCDRFMKRYGQDTKTELEARGITLEIAESE